MATVPNTNPVSLSTITSVFGGGGSLRSAASTAGLSAPDGFNEFKGLSNVSIGSWPSTTAGFYEAAAFKSDLYEAFVRLEFQISGSNVVLRWTKGGSSAMASPVTRNVAFSGSTPQVKVVWSITSQSGTRSSPSGVSSNVYYSIPTSGYRTYMWKAGVAMSGNNTITGTYTAYLNNSAGTINSGSKTFSLSTTAGGGSPK